jgi:hypothetical protein
MQDTEKVQVENMSLDCKNAILELVITQYLGSGDFNGLAVTLLANAADVAAIKELIAEGRLDLVRGDEHPNSHIKALPADPVEVQLEKIDTSGLEGCLYPTPSLLKETQVLAKLHHTPGH